MGHEPIQNAVGWTIIAAPVFGSATISPNQGIIKYVPPDDLTGLPPNDVMTVKGTFKVSIMDTEVIMIPFALFVIDACGLCGGDNSTCAGCDGIPNSGLKFDRCDVCGGDGTTCPFTGVRCDIICIMIIIFEWIALILIVIIAFLIFGWLRRRVRNCFIAPAAPPQSAKFCYRGQAYNLDKDVINW